MNNTFYKLYFKDLIENFEFDNERFFTDTELFAEDVIYHKELLSEEKLFFIKMSEDIYYDILGRNIFKKVDNNIFYNKRSGLYFNENKLVKTNDSNEIINKLFDKEYAYNLKDYFYMHRKLNNIDNEYIKKGVALMLLKGKKFTK